jgi:hypothetical protein
MARATRRNRRNARREKERQYEENHTAIHRALAGQLSMSTEDWLRIRRTVNDYE